jgi:hypothetical protein
VPRTVQVEPLPNPGDVYAFRTSPTSEFADPEMDRIAAFKILGLDSNLVVVAVLDGIWRAYPSLAEASQRSILREHRFAHTGRVAVFGVNAEWWSFDGLRNVSKLGSTSVSAEEDRLASDILHYLPGSRMGALNGVNHSAEGEWRWAHDREALTAEQAQVRAKQEAKRSAAEERYKTRLKNLTWEQLLSETPFERWKTSPPFPNAEFADQARRTVQDACTKLRNLGPKPRKSDVRAILKACVLWFNEADERAGGVIETEEREDICAALEELAYAARHKTLADEIDEWRTW